MQRPIESTPDLLDAVLAERRERETIRMTFPSHFIAFRREVRANGTMITLYYCNEHGQEYNPKRPATMVTHLSEVHSWDRDDAHAHVRQLLEENGSATAIH